MRSPLHVILATALVAASLFASGGHARAQETATDVAEPPEYAALIDGALAEFQAGHWPQARALFERAHASFPNARTQRGIGMASYEMGDFPAAIGALEAALASEARPLTEEQRTQVTALLERARALVGRFTLPAAASDVRLSVDGVSTRPEGDWPSSPGRLALSVGTHEIVLRDRDGRTARTRVTVRGGEDTTIDIVPPGVGTDGASNEGDSAPWIVSGVGAAVAIAGAILFGVGSSDIAAVNAAPAGTEWSSVAGVYDSAPILTGTGLAALIAGSAMVVVGVGWGLERLLSSSGEERRTRVRLAPTALVLEGWF